MNAKVLSKRNGRGRSMDVEIIEGEIKGKNTKPRRRLVDYTALPAYLKDNEFILDYYRAEWPLKEAFLSIFGWHNETLNIWTHLLGFLVFLGLTILNLIQVPEVADFLGHFTRSSQVTPLTNLSQNYGNYFKGIKANPNLDMESRVHQLATTQPKWPVFVFLAGSMFCLLASSISHLLCCHSHRLNLFLWRLDYAGIAVMIAASFFPPIYYIFQCDPLWQFVYLAGISTFGFFTGFTLLTPVFSTARFRPFRAMLFAAMGFSGIIPAVHAVILYWAEPQCWITIAYELGMAVCYSAGTFFYVSRIPERWKPGLFDVAGHSHQIFHVFVIAGALVHYGATLIFLEWRDQVGCDRIR